MHEAATVNRASTVKGVRMDNDTATGREWAGLAVLALPTKGLR